MNELCRTQPEKLSQLILIIENLDAFAIEDRNHMQEITSEVLTVENFVVPMNEKTLVEQISS